MMSCCAFFLRRPRTAAVGLLAVVCLLLPAPLLASRPDIVWISAGHASNLNAVAFSPDGSMLASCADDGTVKLWRVPDLQFIRSFVAKAGWVKAVAFSPDGQMLLSGHSDNAVRLWRVSDGALMRTLIGHTGTVNAVAFSPDGDTVASGGGDAKVRLWKASTGDTLRVLARIRTVTSVAFSPDGELLALADTSGALLTYRTSDWTTYRYFTGHAAEATSVTFSPDGQYLASGGKDKTARLWDSATGRLLQTLNCSNRPVWCVAFSPDGQTLATACENYSEPQGEVVLWRVQDGVETQRLSSFSKPVLSVAYSRDGETLATGVEQAYRPEGSLALWHVSSGTRLAVSSAHTNPVRSLSYSPDGSSLASCSSQAINVWSTANGFLARTLSGELNLSAVSYTPDGQTLVAGRTWATQYGTSGGLFFWSTADWSLLGPQERTDAIYSLAVSPGGNLLATGTITDLWWDGWGMIRLYDMVTRQCVSAWHRHESYANALCFSPDGRSLASGGGYYDGSVILTRVSDGSVLHSLVGHTAYITCLAFSPDGGTLASASYDGTIKLWRVADGALVRTLAAHTGGAYALGFSKDGLTLISGGSDGTIKVWRVSDGAVLRTYDEEIGPAVYSLAVSPGGRTFAYGRSDATVVVAKLPALSAAAARLSADGTSASIADAVVSAVFDGHFYAEEADRSSGIRVDHPAQGLIVGQRVRVEGAMGTNANGERFIAANSIAAAGSGEVEPLHVTGKTLGGGDFGQPPNGQQGITGSFGLNNIGLLVATSGRVSAPRVPSGWFYIDDGSGVSDGTGIPGIYVDAGGLLTPPQGSFATVTGVSSCEWFEGRLVNVLRARTKDDIRVHSGPGTPAAQVAGLEMQSNPRHAR